MPLVYAPKPGQGPLQNRKLRSTTSRKHKCHLSVPQSLVEHAKVDAEKASPVTLQFLDDISLPHQTNEKTFEALSSSQKKERKSPVPPRAVSASPYPRAVSASPYSQVDQVVDGDNHGGLSETLRKFKQKHPRLRFPRLADQSSISWEKNSYNLMSDEKKTTECSRPAVLPRPSTNTGTARSSGRIPLTWNWRGLFKSITKKEAECAPFADIQDVSQSIEFSRPHSHTPAESRTMAGSVQSYASTSCSKWSVRVPPVSHLQPPVNDGCESMESRSSPDTYARSSGSNGEYLDFSNWSIDDSYMDCVCFAHENFGSLKHVNVSHNRISSAGLFTLLNKFERVQIQSLNLESNQLGGPGCMILSKAIRSARWPLTELNLSGNGIGDAGLQALCDCLESCQQFVQLSGLGLAENEMGCNESSGTCLGSYISTARSLKILDLHWNLFRGASACALLSGIYENVENETSTLMRLDLAWNCLGAEITKNTPDSKGGGQDFAFKAANTLASIFQDSTALFHLDLSYNNFKSEECKILADGLKDNHSLFGIHLNGNEATVDDLGFIVPQQIKPKKSDRDQGVIDRSARDRMFELVHGIPDRLRVERQLQPRENELFDSDTYELASSSSNASLKSLEMQEKRAEYRVKVQHPEQFANKFTNAFSRDVRCCWVCENWVEQEIQYIPGISDLSKSISDIKDVWAFFDIDNYERPLKLQPIEETYNKHKIRPLTKKTKGREPRLTPQGKMVRWVGRRMLPPSAVEASIVFQVNDNLTVSDDMPIRKVMEPISIVLQGQAAAPPSRKSLSRKSTRKSTSKEFNEEPPAEDARKFGNIHQVNGVSICLNAIEKYMTAPCKPLVVLEDPRDRSQIMVVPRTVEEAPIVKAERPEWNFSESCWYGYKLDSEKLYLDSFDFDYKCAKIAKVTKDGPEEEAMLNEFVQYLRPRYGKIIAAHRAVLSDCPVIGNEPFGVTLLEFTEFLAGLSEDFYNADFSTSRDSDTIYIAANLIEKEKRGVLFKVVPEKSLSRCQFLEALTRVAIKKFKIERPGPAFEQLYNLMEPQLDAKVELRRKFLEELFNEECDMVVKQHLSMLTGIYDELVKENRYPTRTNKALACPSWLRMLKECGLEGILPRKMWLDAFLLAKETTVDELGGWWTYDMNFKEFLVAVGALAKLREDYKPDFFADLLEEILTEYIAEGLPRLLGSKANGIKKGACVENLQPILSLVRQLFEEADDDGSGVISMREFRAVMYQKEIISEFEEVGIDISNPSLLFKQLDNDGSGEITLDELCAGIVQMAQSARSMERAIAYLTRAFKAADEDQSGFLSTEEFTSFITSPTVMEKLSSLGFDVEDCEDILTMVDSDGGGDVTLDELIDGLQKMRDPKKMGSRAMSLLKKVFRMADSDGGGSLTKSELRSAFEDPRILEKIKKLKLTLPNWNAFFAEHDSDGSGAFSWDEFSQGMQAHFEKCMADEMATA